MMKLQAAFRLPVLAAALLAWAAPVMAQQSGLDAIARADGVGNSVRSYMMEARARATKVDGATASRVYGGRPSQAGAWPHQVALLAPRAAQDNQGGIEYYQFCGGSLIARQWVLTAAHCVLESDGSQTEPGTIFVLTGTNSIVSGGELRPVALVIAHENYNPIIIDNDVALLKLAEPISESTGPVGAIRVLGKDQPLPEGPALVVGWGLMEGDKSPIDLMETDIDIVPNATCNKGMAEQTKRDFGSFLSSMGVSNGIPQAKLEEAYTILINNLGDALSENMICAGVSSGERTSCNGDSGGPLMIRQPDGKWLQVGIVSWGRIPLNSGKRCGNPELYGVYTRVSNYYDWISDKIRTQ